MPTETSFTLGKLRAFSGFHSHKGGGSFKSIGNPRRTIPKNDAVDPFSGTGGPFETATTLGLVDDDESASNFISLRTPVVRNSPRAKR